MKKLTLLILSIFLLFLLPSCQKVIELNLSNSTPALVIQGNVYDHQGPYAITISKTVNFTNTNTFPTVSNATVTINDDAGNAETLNETTAGTYLTSKLRGTPGRTYTLTVTLDGKTYTSISTMPNPVRIDTIYLKKNIFGNGDVIDINFMDPPNADNYYRIIQFINDTLKAGVNIANDKLYQGKEISYSLSATTLSGNNPLKKGDKIAIQLECIDKGVFEYFRTSRGNNGQSASPANPVSNITNGALGYFSACTVRQASMTFP
ncbi:MAG: DUF4249 domain-containing protein [Paludibacter sp.]|nr:DUF4249 domain-containing protein [Paludibacter sp.]